jgi:competence protein ComEA
MKLPNWMMLCLLFVVAMGQYSVNAVANVGNTQISPAYSGSIERLQNSSAARVSMADQMATQTVNINNATVQELSVLPGIGAKKAQAIIAYRELNGKFVSIEELVNVKGIGPKMLAKLSGFVSV